MEVHLNNNNNMRSIKVPVRSEHPGSFNYVAFVEHTALRSAW